MTNPILAETDINTGERFYKNGEGKRNYGVTSVLGVLSKPYLIPWAAKVVAETAAYAIEDLVDTWDCESWLDDYISEDGFETDLFANDLKRVYEWERDDAGGLGDECHEACEDIMRVSCGDGAIARAYYESMCCGYSVEARKRLHHFVRWLEENDVEVIALELTILNDSVGYGGSMDALLRINGVITFTDWKTSKKVDPSMALQLVAYSRGEYTFDDNMCIADVPVKYNKECRAAIVHIQSSKTEVIDIDISDKVFDVFKSVISLKREWFDKLSKEVILGTTYSTKDSTQPKR